MMMSVEQSVDWTARETEQLEENLSQFRFLSTTNSVWPDPGSNLGLRSGKPVTNRLSYGMAIQ
jgi:hypothetical protein